jgi:L-fuculose-phosphate aldolase
MKSLRSEIIKYSKMLNSKKLSALRSGNISARFKDGFLITPSGKKYSSLKNKDIVFVSLDGKFDKKKGIPSSEWKFHQDIYKNKKEAKAIVHAHSTNATAVSTHNKAFLLFITWLLWLEVTILNVQNMQPMAQENYLKIF